MVFCKVCAKRIEEGQEASYHGNNLYKHRSCFGPFLPPPIYHRRMIEFSLYMGPICDGHKRATKIIKRFELFGARVLSYNSDSCFMIYPDDLPERLLSYNDCYSKNIEIPESLVGATGFRREIVDLLPPSYIPDDAPEEHLFLHTETGKMFAPYKMPKLKGGIKVWGIGGS